MQRKQLPDLQLHPLVTATRIPNHDSNLPLRLPLVVLNLFFGKRHRVNRRFWIFPVPIQFPPFGSFLIGFIPSSLVDWVPAPLVSCEEKGWSRNCNTSTPHAPDPSSYSDRLVHLDLLCPSSCPSHARLDVDGPQRP